jgi:hypothetical protein
VSHKGALVTRFGWTAERASRSRTVYSSVRVRAERDLRQTAEGPREALPWRVLIAGSPLLVAAAALYLVLVASGTAPAPLGRPAIDERPSDANWAFVVALGAFGFGGFVAWFRYGRRVVASAAALGACAGVAVAVIA